MISIEERLLLLGKTEVFGSLPVEQQKFICQKLGAKSFPAGEFFFKQGDFGEEAFILYKGQVEIIKDDEVILNLGSGDIVGEMAPLSRGERSASVKAIEDVETLFLKREALTELIHEFPDMSLNLLRVIINRSQKIDNKSFVKKIGTAKINMAEFKNRQTKSATEKKCPNCYGWNPEKTLVCQYCGQTLYKSIYRFFIVAAVCIVMITAGVFVYQHLMFNKKTDSKITKVNIPFVNVQKMIPQEIVLNLEKFGRVRTGKNFTLASELQGRIIETNKKLEKGYIVEKGELLLQISSTDYERTIKRTVNQMKSISARLRSLKQQQKNLLWQLKIAEEQKGLILQKLEKNSDLYNKRAVSETVLLADRQELLNAEKELVSLQNKQKLTPHEISVLEFELADARIKLEQAKLDKAKTKMYSPFRARVKVVHIEESSLVTPQMPLAVLEDMDSVEVVTSVPLNQMPDLVGNNLQRDISVIELKITAEISTLIGDQQYMWLGIVSRFEPMNEKDYTIPVVVQVENKKQQQILEPGSFVKVTLKGQTLKNALVLPQTALRENNTVHIVHNKKLQIRQVKISPYKNNIIVKEGISPGELVILRPIPFAIPGTELEIQIANEQGSKHENN